MSDKGFNSLKVSASSFAASYSLPQLNFNFLALISTLLEVPICVIQEWFSDLLNILDFLLK